MNTLKEINELKKFAIDCIDKAGKFNKKERENIIIMLDKADPSIIIKILLKILQNNEITIKEERK